ncbi:MAG: multicopper oxidase domain-containing protein [Dehalococcoidia bacterium]|nr:multicopper oxidase domain-containing protein [Dehalococcoidia bacterium]
MAGGLIAAACSDGSGGAEAAAQVAIKTTTPGPDGSGGGAQVTATATQTETAELADWEKIDHDHAKGIELFLENIKSPLTRGKGNVELAPRMENGVKVWDLTCDELEWETVPGGFEKGRGYNNMISGPILRGVEGDRVRIHVKNNLKESTSTHWHGLLIPNNMDGVGILTQPEIKPGESFTYEFSLRNAGTHMYHAHHNSMDQVNRGLLGAFIVEPASGPRYQVAKEYVLVMNDSSLGYTINGKGFPATDVLTAKKGEKILIRWMNEGLMNHPMHLHGLPMQVMAIDGYPLPAPYLCDTIDVAPGNRYDTLVDCTEEGLWAFHCHILSHAESPAGFFGLTTVLAITA